MQRLITDTLINSFPEYTSSNPLGWPQEAIWYDRLCLISQAMRAMAIDALWPGNPWVPIVRQEPI